MYVTDKISFQNIWKKTNLIEKWTKYMTRYFSIKKRNKHENVKYFIISAKSSKHKVTREWDTTSSPLGKTLKRENTSSEEGVGH